MEKAMRRISCVLTALALVLLASTQAAAAQLGIAWDANTEPDIAGYIVEWGSGSAPYGNTVDVGNVTSWTLSNAVEGTTYSFRVVAYNSAGERSDPSTAVTGTVTTSVPGDPAPSPSPSPSPGGSPTFAIDRTMLNYGVVRSGTTVSQTTRSQTLVVTQFGG